MLTLIFKNETTNSYDSIRRAMKAAYKDSAAYRMRQIEFDDSLKSENTLQMKIGDYKAVNLQLSCIVTDVKQLSMVISDLLEEAPKKGGKRVNKEAKEEPSEDSENAVDDYEIVEGDHSSSAGVGEGTIVHSTETE